MPLQPYTGTFGKEELLHLLRRSLFGVTVADINLYTGMTLTQVVDELLTFTTDPAPPIKNYWLRDSSGDPDPNLVDPSVPFGTTWVNTPADIDSLGVSRSRRRNSFTSWWMGEIIKQEPNLREKMVLFWKNFLATESRVVSLPESIYQLNQLYRSNCLGNFRSLIFETSIQPGMLIYLNGKVNIAAAPDENYARELMELFTLGEGSGYTETDVQEAARILTGWKVSASENGIPIVASTAFNPNQHDTADKQFSAYFNNTLIQGVSGETGGAEELNALLDMIFTKEDVSKHVCRELYRFFVHSAIDANIEQQVIEELAVTFRNEVGNPDQMKIVMSELLSSAAFFDTSIRGCMVRSPMDFIVGNIRLFKQPFPDPFTQFEALYSNYRDAYTIASISGQDIENPPNVAGWPAFHQFPQFDELWLDTATYPLRKAVYEAISVVGFSTRANLYQTASQNTHNLVDFVDFVSDLSNPSDPDILLQDLTDLLFAVPVSQSVRDQLKQNYLLFGQTVNFYWTLAYDEYIADPSTTDSAAQLVPTILITLILDMQGAAEHHLM